MPEQLNSSLGTVSMYTRRLLFGVVVLTAACAGKEPTTPPLPTPTISLGATLSAGVVTRSTSATTTLTITRGGEYAGAVTLTAESLPTGVTAAFNPSSLSGASLSSTLTLSASALAANANTAITIRASGAGVTAQTVVYALTVQPDPIALSPQGSAFSVSRGGSSSVALNLTRFNAPGAVTMTAENLPTGVTATFTPRAVTNDVALLTLTASAGATLGATTITVRGTMADGATATTPVTLTVAAAGSGASIAWRFCTTQRTPAWLAFRDGSSGAFTRVLQGPNSTFNFALTSNVGVVAMVITGLGTPFGEIYYGSASELAALAAEACFSSPSFKTLTVNFAGLSAGHSGRIGAAEYARTVLFPTTATSFPDVLDGPLDMLADRGVPVAGDPARVPDRFIIRRGVNYPPSSVMPLLDFSGGEAVVPVNATVSIAGADGGALQFNHFFGTANGIVGRLSYFPLMYTTATSYAAVGVPTAALASGEHHVIRINRAQTNGDDFRFLEQYHREWIDRTVTVGPMLVQPTLSSVGSGTVAYLRATGSWQAEYGHEIELQFLQASGNRDWTIVGRRSYFGTGATSFSLDVPDFSAVPGFTPSWGISAGVVVDVTVFGRSARVTAFSEGVGFRAAQRVQQSITP